MVNGWPILAAGIDVLSAKGSCSAMTPLPWEIQPPAVTVTEAVTLSLVPRATLMRSPVASPTMTPPSTVHAYVDPGRAATATVAVPDLHAVGGTCTTTAS